MLRLIELQSGEKRSRKSPYIALGRDYFVEED